MDKDLYEIMRGNDAPMGVLAVCSIIIDDLEKGKTDTFDIFYRVFYKIKKIYDNINWNAQTEKTGIDILKKSYIELNKLEPFIEKTMQEIQEHSDLTQDTQIMGELIEKIGEDTSEYGNLPAYKEYKKNFFAEIKEMKISRGKWFELGKPYSISETDRKNPDYQRRSIFDHPLLNQIEGGFF